MSIKKHDRIKIVLFSLFGIAFGWLEAVVVVYIRKIMGAEKIVNLNGAVFEQADWGLLRVEQTREVATIIMLVSLALVAFKGWKKRVAGFLWVFATWDIFYYVGLKMLIKWPPSLAAIDCLFLIPRPWIAPVWLPIVISLGMLTVAMVLFLAAGEE